ncbi:polyadenylate-binding protein-interacting protein 1 isoform 2-T2 [Rhinophrynus dorsalis]
MSDGFDRAPGAGRSRGRGILSQATGAGRGRGRAIEATDSGKVPGFRAQGGVEETGRSSVPKTAGTHQQEPLRPPRTVPPGAVDPVTVQLSQKRSPAPAQLPTKINLMAVSKGQPADPGAVISNLSVNAAEFYPSGYSVESNNYVEENGGYIIPPEPTLSEYVQDFLNHLTEQPGSFEAEIYPFSEILSSCVTADDMVQDLVELIYVQATTVSNFSYTGARLCNYLSNNLHTQSRNFRQMLLLRCQTEFDKRDQAAKGDLPTRKRFHAFVLFLGELYLNLEIKGAKGQVTRAEILQTGLRELLNALFSNPVDDNLICAVKLLKLTGSVLEDAWKEKGMSCMEEVIQRIENVVLDADCSRDVKQMLLKLVELRSSNWGRVQVASTFKEATPDNDPNYFMNEPTFYTSEGVPFTAADPDYQEKYQELLDREDLFPDYEENGTDLSGGGDAFFDDYDDDEMDPEMEEAYEKFCLESECKKKQ